MSWLGCSSARPGTACTDVAPVPDYDDDDDDDDENGDDDDDNDGADEYNDDDDDNDYGDDDDSPITASLLPWQLKSFGQEFVWKLKPWKFVWKLKWRICVET